jgi:hypothetical protein
MSVPVVIGFARTEAKTERDKNTSFLSFFLGSSDSGVYEELETTSSSSDT